MGGEIVGLDVQLARSQFLLALPEPGDHLFGLFLEPFVARAGVHHTRRREVMPHKLGATDATGCDSAAIRFGDGTQTGFESETVKQPVRLE